MRSKLDIASWNRKEHYEFFGGFNEPFFGITTHVDFTLAYQKIQDLGYSYFLYYLHKSISAANTVAPFRYRIDDNELFVYDSIHASPTVGREDHTFGFSFMEFDEDYEVFEKNAQKDIARVQQSTGLSFSPEAKRLDTIHYSSIPWYNFTSIAHARHFDMVDSIPKISFGKYTKENGKISLPTSVHVNHALMDGYHVGQYLEEFQRLLNQ